MQRCFCCHLRGACVVVLFAEDMRALVCERCARERGQLGPLE